MPSVSSNDKLRIGLVLDTSLDPNDGVQQYVVTLGEWLRAQGHDVHYLVGQTEQRQLPNIHSLARNVGVRFNGNRTTIPLPTGRRKLKRFLAGQPFDVLHVQTPHHPLMAQRLILAADPQTAVIGTFHIAPYNRLATLGNRLLGLWLRPSLKRFDKIVSVSPAAADFARQTFGIETEVVPNVIDYQLYAAAKPLDKYRGRPVVLFLGRLVPRKGSLKLLEAAALLRQRPGAPDFRVVVCGSGPLRPRLERFISDRGLHDIVELSGFIDEADKPGYYASAAVSAFPSSGGESFGIVLLEAMASGQAVVLAGNNPGYASVMSPQPQLLFEATNAEQLADKLSYYLSEPVAADEMRRWGTGYAADFDVARVGATLLGIYEQALRKRRGL